MFMTFLLIGVVLLMVEAAIPGFGIFGVTGLFSLLAALFLYLGGGGQALSLSVPCFFDPCPRLLVLSQRPAQPHWPPHYLRTALYRR